MAPRQRLPLLTTTFPLTPPHSPTSARFSSFSPPSSLEIWSDIPLSPIDHDPTQFRKSLRFDTSSERHTRDRALSSNTTPRTTSTTSSSASKMTSIQTLPPAAAAAVPMEMEMDPDLADFTILPSNEDGSFDFTDGKKRLRYRSNGTGRPSDARWALARGLGRSVLVVPCPTLGWTEKAGRRIGWGGGKKEEKLQMLPVVVEKMKEEEEEPKPAVVPVKVVETKPIKFAPPARKSTNTPGPSEQISVAPPKPTPQRAKSRLKDDISPQTELVTAISELRNHNRQQITEFVISSSMIKTARSLVGNGKLKLAGGETVESITEMQALEIEHYVYMNHSNDGELTVDYRKRMKEINFNLKFNTALTEDILTGFITGEEVSQMSTATMVTYIRKSTPPSPPRRRKSKNTENIPASKSKSKNHPHQAPLPFEDSTTQPSFLPPSRFSPTAPSFSPSPSPSPSLTPPHISPSSRHSRAKAEAVMSAIWEWNDGVTISEWARPVEPYVKEEGVSLAAGGRGVGGTSGGGRNNVSAWSETGAEDVWDLLPAEEEDLDWDAEKRGRIWDGYEGEEEEELVKGFMGLKVGGSGLSGVNSLS